VTTEQEQLAELLAERGREEMLGRLRPAFEQAAAPYAEALGLDEKALDEMARGAAERADAAFWRRSLAAAAQAELGLELGEALIHPAVARAHELAGAPPYQSGNGSDPGSEITVVRTGREVAPPASQETVGSAPAPSPTDETEAQPTHRAIRLPAVHLGGIGNLERGEESLELRVSAAGLDIVRTETASTLGRLEWSEIQALETPRTRKRRQRRQRAQLLVKTERGEAHFEIPGIGENELKGYVDPLFEAYHGPEEPPAKGRGGRRRRSRRK
jgi:hypothetical protein